MLRNIRVGQLALMGPAGWVRVARVRRRACPQTGRRGRSAAVGSSGADAGRGGAARFGRAAWRTGRGRTEQGDVSPCLRMGRSRREGLNRQPAGQPASDRFEPGLNRLETIVPASREMEGRERTGVGSGHACHRRGTHAGDAEESLGHGAARLPGKRIEWVALADGVQRDQRPATAVLPLHDGPKQRCGDALTTPRRPGEVGLILMTGITRPPRRS